MSVQNRSSRLSNAQNFANAVRQAIGGLTSVDEKKGAGLRDLACALSAATIFCPTELDRVRESCEIFASEIIKTAADHADGLGDLGLNKGQIFFLQMVYAEDSGIDRYVKGLDSIVSVPTRAALRPIWTQVRTYSSFNFVAEKGSDNAATSLAQNRAPLRPAAAQTPNTPVNRKNGFKRIMDLPCAF